MMAEHCCARFRLLLDFEFVHYYREGGEFGVVEWRVEWDAENFVSSLTQFDNLIHPGYGQVEKLIPVKLIYDISQGIPIICCV